MLTFGSLFAGIGGIDLGLERSGMRCAWQVEIDEYCNKVLSKHWPDVPRFRDVRECGALNLARVDLIAGGFPCQGISDAGKREGLDDPRSGLWGEFARIICELRPRYVLVENVAALLHRGLGRVLGDLAALRYDAEWHCIPAAAVGAPHRRDRLFIVAYAQSDRCGAGWARGTASAGTRQEDTANMADAQSARGRRLHEPTGWQLPFDPIGRSQDVADTASRPRGAISADIPEQLGPWRLRAGSSEVGRVWATEPDVGRVAHGVPHRVDRLRGLGNAVVPQVAEFIGRCIMEAQIISTAR